MYVKIYEQSQLVLLASLNGYLRHRIPPEVLRKSAGLLEGQCNREKGDFVALFLKPLKDEYLELLGELQLYPSEAVFSDGNFYTIQRKRKQKKIWNWCEISVEGGRRRIFAVYCIRRKDFSRR